MGKFKLLEKKEVDEVVSVLESRYPNIGYYLNFEGPLQLLVAALLSPQTKDTVVNSITPALFSKYKKVEDFAHAKPQDLTPFIRKVSFADNKAKNIIECCKIIIEKYNSNIPDNMEDLLSLPGIGRKTANTVLINAFGKLEGIPVDTWVIRLSNRIGLSGSKKPDEIENDLKEKINRKYWKNIAYVIKEHGHQICQSSNPKCDICPLNKICPRNGVK